MRVSHTLAQAGTRGDQGGRLKAHMSIEQQRGKRSRANLKKTLHRGPVLPPALTPEVLGAWSVEYRLSVVRDTRRGCATGRLPFFFYTLWGAIVDGAGDRYVSVRPSCAPHRASYLYSHCARGDASGGSWPAPFFSRHWADRPSVFVYVSARTSMRLRFRSSSIPRR